MSRGHGASRRRNYGRRQSEVRHRTEVDLTIDLQGPSAWPRGSGWDAGSDSPAHRPASSSMPHGNQAAH
jgi:hypothetical protein